MEDRVAKREKSKKASSSSYFDYTFLIAVFFLLGFGLIMIYSVSYYQAQADYDNKAFFLIKQARAVGLGIVGMMIVAAIPYSFWRKFSWLGFLLSIVLVALVPFIGVESHGAKRWLKIPGTSTTFQPAEIAKLCVILLLADLICRMGRKIKLLRSMILILAISGGMGVMVWVLTDNLSSGIIIAGIGIFMFFVASPDYKWFIGVATVGIVVLSGFLYYLSQLEMSEDMNFRFKRILAWMNPEMYKETTGFQTIQSLYAIGSGGVLGKGLGHSMQKLGFIPEAQNDMIFSIICEELGLFGAAWVILLFVLLIWRMMVIATNAPDLFGALLVVGVMGHIAIQVILNIAVVTNTIPNTGISLPFISYGGTSVLFLMIEMGLVLSVSKRIQLKEV